MAHRISYCAKCGQCSSLVRNDLLNKLAKAKEIKAYQRFFTCQAPCPTGWGHGSEKTAEIGKTGRQTGLVFTEYENGKVT